MEVKIICPLVTILPRKTVADKRYRVNLNEYRNWSFIVANEVKKQFKLDMAPQLEGLKLCGELDVTFRLFKQSKRRTDKSNFYSILSKFLYDAMSELDVIDDDNDAIIRTELLLETRIDKINPRAEFTFKERKNSR